MDLAADLPVTLVIKAPNQRVGDQTVECMLGWTVRKLKQHLTNVYPSKPVSASNWNVIMHQTFVTTAPTYVEGRGIAANHYFNVPSLQGK